jgi:hypothetical protein
VPPLGEAVKVVAWPESIVADDGDREPTTRSEPTGTVVGDEGWLSGVPEESVTSSSKE